ncbi:hypothetical protein BX600DRAFT_390997 [Xylariales sp. PMI_506]|nr:hypothetical protein BX600DRAFT_390997 [Xylariales sp. PMI_506]
MVKQRKGAKAAAPVRKNNGGPPAPFKEPPEVLLPLIETLEEKHVYILHIDPKPADFKRNIFMVPCLMNIAIVGLIIWRMYRIVPWYLELLASTLGYANDSTLIAAELEWDELTPVVLKRAFQFCIDLVLYIVVLPWPWDFAVGKSHGSPLQWRWSVGFRSREIVARRSRTWDKTLGDVSNAPAAWDVLRAYVDAATAPMLLEQKTGYLTMNSDWDLDWGVMIDATTMVDKKMAALEAFRLVVLVYSQEYGWLSVDMKSGENAKEDERRRQVFLFRDALSAMEKEKLFYRWIEIIQFESTQPGGFGPEKQEAVAKQVRELFQKEGVDFDQLWRESVGTEGLAGM